MNRLNQLMLVQTVYRKQVITITVLLTLTLSLSFLFLQFSFLHNLAVLMDPQHWLEVNKLADTDHRLPSYSVYLECTYRDLMVSTGMLQQPHCEGANPTAKSSSSRRVLRTAGSLSGDEEKVGMEWDSEGVNSHREALSGIELPYCQAYNLIMTASWMMVVPRQHGSFEGLIDVNGLGKFGFMLMLAIRFLFSSLNFQLTHLEFRPFTLLRLLKLHVRISTYCYSSHINIYI